MTLKRLLGKHPKIVMACDDRIGKHPDGVLKVLKALGHVEALVTDESSVSDFLDVFASKSDKEAQLRVIGKRLGMGVRKEDLICDLAEKAEQGG